MDLDKLGIAENVEQNVRIQVDKNSETGYKGLPKEWEKNLVTAGLSMAEIKASPRAAFEVASIQFKGGIQELLKEYGSLKGNLTLKMLMKQSVDIKHTDPRKVYSINFEEDRLGGGSFGEVFLCRQKPSGKKFAMKVSTVAKIKILEREIRMHALSNGHKNIVAFQEAFNYKKKIFLVVELMDGGSLFDYIYEVPKKIRWREKAITYVVRSMLRGLAHMHARHHLHRDIKSQNILINLEGEIKIADFGFAVGLTKEQKKRHTVLGSPFWMAPELIGKEPYGPKVDVWSTAITAFEAAEHQPPHMGESAVRVLFLIRSQPSPKLKEKDGWSKLFKHFLKMALRKDPIKRPSSSELLMHPLLAKENVCKRSSFAKMIVAIRKMKEEAESDSD